MMATVEERLLALEDRQAIYQVVCGYGYSVDGCNAVSVGDRYVEDGVYAVGDMPSWVGRDAIAAITRALYAHRYGSSVRITRQSERFSPGARAAGSGREEEL